MGRSVVSLLACELLCHHHSQVLSEQHEASCTHAYSYVLFVMCSENLVMVR